MTMDSTRRDFLKVSTLGLSAAAIPASAPAKVDESGAAPDGMIEVWVTNSNLRCARAGSLRWQPASGTPLAEAIVLRPDKKFQEILGFGAAFTDAACYLFQQLPEEARDQLFHELFHPSQTGLSVCRTCIGASDYSRNVFSYDEGDPDPELTRFSIAHDQEYILPVLSQARAANPDLFLFCSPWSPPGWMKAGGSMLGGSMRQKYFASYAQYFLKFLQGYAAAGVPVQAVTSQNEPDTDQDGRMPACIWPQEYEIGFVRDHLGPLFEKNGISTKIWILDHNYNLWGRAVCELDDPGLRRYCNAVAWHGYAGKPEMMSKVHEAYPEVNMYWTEGGPDYTTPDYLTDWVGWGNIFTGVLRNWCQAITGWNLALDERGQPNIGPFSCGGLVTIHSQTKEITRSGQYWAFVQFSRFIRRGARRIESQGASPGVQHVALENPDGRRVIILTNAGAERTAKIAMNGAVAEVHLDQDSLTTLLWK